MNFTGTFEAAVMAAQQMDLSLSKEKSKTERLEKSLSEMKISYERLLREAQSSIREISIQNEKLRKIYHTQKAHIETLSKSENEQKLEAQRLDTELQRFKRAWSEVIQREREAKMILVESQETKARAQQSGEKVRTLEDQLRIEKQARIEAESRGEKIREELQSVMIKLHSAEARFNQVTREIGIQNISQKEVESRLERIEDLLEDMARVNSRATLQSNLHVNPNISPPEFRHSLRAVSPPGPFIDQ